MVLFVVSNETQTHNQGIIYLGKILSWDWTEIETEVLSQWEFQLSKRILGTVPALKAQNNGD